MAQNRPLQRRRIDVNDGEKERAIYANTHQTDLADLAQKLTSGDVIARRRVLELSRSALQNAGCNVFVVLESPLAQGSSVATPFADSAHPPASQVCVAQLGQ